jgi:uncharacterized phage protein (TIGR02220 family)
VGFNSYDLSTQRERYLGMTETERALFLLADKLGYTITLKANGKGKPFNEQAIEILNRRLKTTFKHTTKTTEKLLNVLRSDGYTIDEVKAVVEYKANEWEYDEKWSKFLRPSTLFAQENFEKYLQASKMTKGSKMYDLFTKESWDE